MKATAMSALALGVSCLPQNIAQRTSKDWNARSRPGWIEALQTIKWGVVLSWSSLHTTFLHGTPKLDPNYFGTIP